jgi:hypothetical protein
VLALAIGSAAVMLDCLIDLLLLILSELLHSTLDISALFGHNHPRIRIVVYLSLITV